VIYVYGICDLPATTTINTPGVDGRPVSLGAVGDLIVAHSIGLRAGVPVTTENVWQHERALEALMALAAVLPARFGTTFDRDADLAAALGPHTQHLRDGLARVRGCDEWGVRVLAASAEQAIAATTTGAPPASDGRTYMLRRAAEERRSREARERADAIAETIYADLAKVAVDARRKALAEPAPILSAAFLVRRERATEFHHRVRQLTNARPDLRILGTGPWPPYHFTPALRAQEATHA
jgi:hypothetical protein